ncbi:hypothetical protein [Amycolatopsis kentuckyensis]|uniref:hypothetical protein n=1 Tax=Amycolatopsis kentuckyensis TaxID=218823 RepID=UPI001178A76F|nr:hypothetical protein [Amycolatopsis kentuckyensis]
MSDNFWLLEWMDSSEIKTASDVEKAIADKGKFRELSSMAVEQSALPGQNLRTNNPIVAGRGIDLSGELTAADEVELTGEVDRAFGSTWHYFDEIVVEGLSARRYAKMILNKEYDTARERVRDHCRLLLHLRRIGALENVVFRQKLDPCVQHGRDVSGLEAAGLKRIMDDREEIVQTLTRGVIHQIEDHYIYGEHFHFVYEHPLTGIQWGHLSGSPAGREEDELKRMISEELFSRYAEFAAADVAMARELSAPLATLSPVLESILSPRAGEIGASAGSFADEVAVEIGVPILNGVSASDLLKIREDEMDAFERFRSALRAGINEAIAKGGEGLGLGQVGAGIVEEFISPALHDIDQRLNVARKVMARKSATNISIGAAVLVVGLISGIPLLLPAGVALGSAIPGVHLAKYFEEKGQVELSDMYFLWKLQGSQK